MIDSLVFLQGLFLALLMGLLVGIEREKTPKGEGDHQIGVRTMSLISILGFLSYTLFSSNIPLLAITFAGFFALVIASYIVTSLKGDTGATTEFAAVLVYLSGVLVAMDLLMIAAALVLTVLTLLYFKQKLHDFADNVTRDEVYAGLKFIAIAFVVLPLLPNEIMGPLEVINPYSIWFVVVLISSISLVSYAAIKIFGPKKGIGFGGFLGGLVSSTAVSMSFSELSKKNKKIVNPFVFGVLIASTAMFFRVLVEVFALNPSLLQSLLVPMGAMGLTGVLITLVLWLLEKSSKKSKFNYEDLNLKSPFQLKPAIQFGLLFAALLMVSKYANQTFGDQGLYITALISGVMDVDAITVSMANLEKAGEISKSSASIAITIAAMTNTLSKGLIVFAFGAKKVGTRVLLGMGGMMAAGALSLFFFNPGM